MLLNDGSGPLPTCIRFSDSFVLPPRLTCQDDQPSNLRVKYPSPSITESDISLRMPLCQSRIPPLIDQIFLPPMFLIPAIFSVFSLPPVVPFLLPCIPLNNSEREGPQSVDRCCLPFPPILLRRSHSMHSTMRVQGSGSYFLFFFFFFLVLFFFFRSSLPRVSSRQPDRVMALVPLIPGPPTDHVQPVVVRAPCHFPLARFAIQNDNIILLDSKPHS